MSLTMYQLQRQRVVASGRVAGITPASAPLPRRMVCRAQASSESHSMNNENAAGVIALGASAATALIAKVSLLNPAGALLASTLQTKNSDKPLEVATSNWQAVQASAKVAFATAPELSGSGPYAALPSSWLVVTSAAHWFEQHRLAAASGALLATVFISDAAARDQGSLLERLRRTYGGESGPVRFVFVHVGAGYVQRSAAASRSAAAAGLRGREALTDLGRVSHVAALHGLDVALGSFLPSGGLRAVPSMLLARPGVVPAAPVGTAGSGRSSVVSKEDADEHPAEACWAAASRTGELRQLVSDWAFINTAFARAAAAASTGASMAANNAASSQTCRGHGAVADANSNIVPFHATSACACRLPHTGDTAA